MEPIEGKVRYSFTMKPGEWIQHDNGQIDIAFPGGKICVGHIGESLDNSEPLKLTLEGQVAK